MEFNIDSSRLFMLLLVSFFFFKEKLLFVPNYTNLRVTETHTETS